MTAILPPPPTTDLLAATIGRPEYATLPPGSTPEQAAVAQLARDTIATPDKLAALVQTYRDRFTDAHGVTEVSTDNACELMPKFGDRPEHRSTYTVAVQAPAKMLSVAVADQIFGEIKAEGAAADGAPRYALVTAGGVGSGKGSALGDVHPDRSGWITPGDHPAVVLDQTLSSMADAEKKIGGARAAGLDAVIAYVHRPLEAAAMAAVDRAEKDGRIVPAPIIGRLHADAQTTLLALADAYRDDPHVHIHVIDNSGPRGSAHEASLDLIAAARLDQSDAMARSTAAVNARIAQAAEEGHPLRAATVAGFLNA